MLQSLIHLRIEKEDAMSDFFLSIDSGTKKCGLAVLNGKLEVKERYVINIKQLKSEIEVLTKKYNLSKIILGKGTGWKVVKKAVEEAASGKLKIEVCDEKYSTELAQIRKGNFFHKIVYLINVLFNKEKPVDDISAIIIAEKYLKSKGGSK